MGEPLPPLTVQDFPAFFAELWTRNENPQITPFPWQIDLMAEVQAARRWPALVDLPTGSGKTSLMEMAVFLLALDADSEPEHMWMPRRIALIVDRRVIVDQADQRGGHIVTALSRALAGHGSQIMQRVAKRLSHLSRGHGDLPGGPPLVNTVLRGGIIRDETWSRRPDVPALISSTVDQVGSRVLFRGYGLSASMRPIHAGLLTNDTLLLLDEVHLSRPFAETLDMLVHYRSLRTPGRNLPDRWQAVQLTATPGRDHAERFPRAPLDVDSHEVLARRLRAAKPARLVLANVAANPAKANQDLANACVREARSLLADGARTFAVVVNRVDTARRVAQLAMKQSDKAGWKVALLTGRMRSLDRDQVLNSHIERLRIGHERSSSQEPLLVVATQSVEAGADFDFDGIVTECASLDALRQRFGRVDRDGQLADDGHPAQSVILVRSTDLNQGADDPIYGSALRQTWTWLSQREPVDFGILAMGDHVRSSEVSALLPQPSRAPLLCPQHLDAWAQTSPVPSVVPDCARWLHGVAVSEQAADVEIVWRDDLDESLFTSTLGGQERNQEGLSAKLQREVSDRIAALPPKAAETLSVPLRAFRRWASEDPDDVDTSDVDGVYDPPADDRVTSGRRPPEKPPARRILRWRSGMAEMVEVDQIGPGDTVVVPATRGGLSLGNWDPAARTPVEDLADAAHAQGSRVVVRLPIGPGTTLDQGIQTSQSDDSGRPLADELFMSDQTTLHDPPTPSELEALTGAEQRAAIAEYLTAVGAKHRALGGVRVPAARQLVIRSFVQALALDATPERSYVVWFRTVPGRLGTASDAEESTDDDARDSTSFIGGRVLLRDHLQGVGSWAAGLARNLGFPESVSTDLQAAGELHDLGKLDPRFQMMLHGGDVVEATSASTPLAKSGTGSEDWQARRRAQRLSGYPAGRRHELLSVALMPQASLATGALADPELVAYLVGTHHGGGRSRFAPQTDLDGRSIRAELADQTIAGDTDHQLDRLDQGVPARFWTVLREWGWFQLAWLEAVLRLADHGRSAQEQAGVDSGKAASIGAGGQPRG